MPVVVFAVWTVFVWGGRIRNALADDGGADVGAVVLAGLFIVLASVVLVRRDARWTTGLAVLTVGVWVVRSFDIAVLSDHDAAFVAVHLALAAVSVALAAWAVASLTRSGRAPRRVGAPG